MKEKNIFTDTMEPGEIEEASMEDSESQILQPLVSTVSTASSDIRPIKSVSEIKEGNFLEASSRQHLSSPSVNSTSDEVLLSSDCESLDADF